MHKENSMDDPTPMDIDLQPAPSVTYEMVEEGSKRRCKKLINSIGYSYSFKEKNRNDQLLAALRQTKRKSV